MTRLPALETLILPLLFMATKTLPVESQDATVVVLNDLNFESFTQAATGQTTGKWFVNFHSPNCGHCKMLKPTWEDFAESIAASNPEEGVIVAEVNVIQNRQLMKRFSIDRFPVLKYFPGDGSMRTYGGLRDVDDFVSYVLGGYEKDTAEDVPPGPNKLIETIQDLRVKFHKISFLRVTLEDFEHIIEFRKNAAVFLLIIGMILGYMLTYLFSGGTSSSKVQKAKQE